MSAYLLTLSNFIKRKYLPESSTSNHDNKQKRIKMDNLDNGVGIREEIFIDSDDDEPTMVKGKGSRDNPIEISEIKSSNPNSVGRNKSIIGILDDEEKIVLPAAPNRQSRGEKNDLIFIDNKLSAEEILFQVDWEIPDISDDELVTAPSTLAREASPELDQEPSGTFSDRDARHVSEASSPEKPSYSLPGAFPQEFWTESPLNASTAEKDDESVPELNWSQDIIEPDDFKETFHPQDTHSTKFLAAEEQETLQHAKASQPVSYTPEGPRKPKTLRKPKYTDPEAAKYNIDRKNYFFKVICPRNRNLLNMKALRYLAHVHEKMEKDKCWIYAGSLPDNRNLHADFSFKFRGKRTNYRINIALVQQILEGKLTDAQKEGIIYEAWHASHLCGNWTCINPNHVIAEPGAINISRNRCFLDKDGPCSHEPKCLKHLKVVQGKLQVSFSQNVSASDGSDRTRSF